MVTREHAIGILKAQNPEPHLIQHALASEAIMQKLALYFNESTELWGLAGLVHDVDFPITKTASATHGLVAQEILKDFPEELKYAVAAHNGEMTGTLPKTRLDFALRCAETVTGLIITAALVRPQGLRDMQPKSLKKKMKDKAFAASVCRETIKECEKLPLDLDTFLTLGIAALQEKELELGLTPKDA